MDGMQIHLVESGVITKWLDQLVLTPHPSTPATASQQTLIPQVGHPHPDTSLLVCLSVYLSIC